MFVPPFFNEEGLSELLMLASPFLCLSAPPPFVAFFDLSCPHTSAEYQFFTQPDITLFSDTPSFAPYLVTHSFLPPRFCTQVTLFLNQTRFTNVQKHFFFKFFFRSFVLSPFFPLVPRRVRPTQLAF